MARKQAKKKRKMDWQEIVKNETFYNSKPSTIQQLRKEHPVEFMFQEIVQVLEKNLKNSDAIEQRQISSNGYEMLFYLKLKGASADENEVFCDLILEEPFIGHSAMLLFFAQEDSNMYLETLLQNNLNNANNCEAIVLCWSTQEKQQDPNDMIPEYNHLLDILGRYPDLIQYAAEFSIEFPKVFTNSMINMSFHICLSILPPTRYNSQKLPWKQFSPKAVELISEELVNMIFDCYLITGTIFVVNDKTSTNAIEDVSLHTLRHISEHSNCERLQELIKSAL